METAIQTANQITIKDGVAVIDGRQIYIGYGESENIAILQIRHTWNVKKGHCCSGIHKKQEDTGVEDVKFKVINGTPASGSAEDPAINNMDIRTGVSVSQKPFCRVRLNGTAIEGIDSMMNVGNMNSLSVMLVASEPMTLEAGQTKPLTIKYKCPKTPKVAIAQADGGAPFECAVSSWGQEHATVAVKSTEKLTNRKVRLIILY